MLDNKNLIINYKLKLTEAKALRYDKDPVYLKEFQSYKNQLTQSYLTDKNVTDDLVREAYDRTTNEVKAQHILILLDEVETDTLAVYSKVEAYRERLVNEDFESLKKELSKILAPDQREKLFLDYYDLETKLGGKGASRKTAKSIVSDLKKLK